MDRVDIIKSKIRSIPGFPKEGIIFRDITTLINDAEGLRLTIDALKERYAKIEFDRIAAIEARGFILGGALAYELGKSMVLVRKKGKLPYKTESYEYDLEYGTDVIEVHVDAIKKGEKILIIDDLLATGGTSLASAKLVERLGGEVVEMAFVVDLPEVGGRKAIEDAGYKMFHICEFEGE